MISLGALALFFGYTLVYAAVANGGALAYAPWLAWEKDASAYRLDHPLGPGQRRAHGTTEQPSSDTGTGGGGPAPQPQSFTRPGGGERQGGGV